MSLPSETVELNRLIAERGDKAAIVQQFLKAVIVVPVKLAADEHTGSVAPLTVERGGHENVVVFTTADGAKQVAGHTPDAMTMSGTSLVLRTPEGMGMLVFSDAGNVAFEPSLLAAIRRDMRDLSDPRTSE